MSTSQNNESTNPQNNGKTNSQNTDDKPSIGLSILSFFIPLVGFILAAVNWKSKPISAKRYLIISGIAFAFCIFANIVNPNKQQVSNADADKQQVSNADADKQLASNAERTTKVKETPANKAADDIAVGSTDDFGAMGIKAADQDVLLHGTVDEIMNKNVLVFRPKGDNVTRDSREIRCRVKDVRVHNVKVGDYVTISGHSRNNKDLGYIFIKDCLFHGSGLRVVEVLNNKEYLQ